MATKIPGYEETVVCPYNKSHVIMKSRIQTHLVKCARIYPDMKLEICPFDVTHRYKPEEKKSHIETCPSRESFDHSMYTVQSGYERPQPEQAPKPQPVVYDDEESWDNLNTSTYDPQKYARNAAVLRAPTGMTPSERRKFADKERQRLSALNHRNRPVQNNYMRPTPN